MERSSDYDYGLVYFLWHSLWFGFIKFWNKKLFYVLNVSYCYVLLMDWAHIFMRWIHTLCNPHCITSSYPGSLLAGVSILHPFICALTGWIFYPRSFWSGLAWYIFLTLAFFWTRDSITFPLTFTLMYSQGCSLRTMCFKFFLNVGHLCSCVFSS